MHPADVAAYVAAQFQVLEQQLSERPELGVRSAELRGDLDIQLAITLRLRETEIAQENRLLLPGGQPIGPTYNVPILGRPPVERPTILALNCSDFDGRPPTAELLQEDGQPLPPQLWPRESSGGGIVMGYAKYQRPFFCRPGLREYHEHPQHQDDPWDRHREGATIGRIVLGLLRDLTERWTMGM